MLFNVFGYQCEKVEHEPFEINQNHELSLLEKHKFSTRTIECIF